MEITIVSDGDDFDSVEAYKRIRGVLRAAPYAVELEVRARMGSEGHVQTRTTILPGRPCANSPTVAEPPHEGEVEMMLTPENVGAPKGKQWRLMEKFARKCGWDVRTW